jgi:hypothetical protein
MDQPVLAEVIRLALNHGTFHTRAVRDEAQAMAVLHEWHPQLAIVDMDLAKGQILDHLLAAPTQTLLLPGPHSIERFDGPLHDESHVVKNLAKFPFAAGCADLETRLSAVPGNAVPLPIVQKHRLYILGVD